MGGGVHRVVGLCLAAAVAGGTLCPARAQTPPVADSKSPKLAQLTRDPVGVVARPAAVRDPLPQAHLVWLFRERGQSVLVDRIAEAVGDGRSDDAVALLRRLLAQDHDSWMISADGRDVVSVRSHARRVLWESAAARCDSVDIWERELAGAVREDLPDAALWEVLSAGSGTEAANRAARVLAGRLADRGELGLAVALLGAGGVSESGRRSLEQLLAESPGEGVGGREQAVGMVGTRGSGERRSGLPRVPEANEWSLPLGDRSGKPAFGRGVPVLRPEWGWLMAAADSQELRVLDQWKQLCEERGFPPVMPIAPVIVGDTVVFRTAGRVMAMGLFDGRMRWGVDSDQAVHDWIDDVAAGAAGPEITSTLREWFGANEKLRGLASDGQRVFLIDGPAGVTRSAGNRGFRVVEPVNSAVANRLVALHLAAAGPGQSQVAWEVVASDRGRQEGCHFLGHPVAVGEWLLCLAELQREIVLLVMQSETGQIVWRQPLAAVPNRLTDDSEKARLWRNYSPVVAGGVAICPTGTGLAVAVDLVRRELKWLQAVGPAPQALPAIRRGAGMETPPTPDPWGFLSRWQIVGDTLYLAAPESRFLQAVDVETGGIRWRAPLGEREFFAGIMANSAVVLGGAEVRRHSLIDGGVLGKTSLPAHPAGQPLLLADRLVIPLLNGERWSIDPATGDVLTDAWLHSGPGCEHLYPAGELVVAVRPDSVAVYPTADQARRELELARASGRLSDAARLEAELSILDRDLKAAETFLEVAVETASSEGQRQPIQRRLREILLAGLQRGDIADVQRFRRLRDLSVSPVEMAEVRIRESAWLRQQGRWAALLDVLDEMGALPGDALTAVAEDPERQVTIDGFRGELARDIVDSPARQEFATRLKRQLDRALRERDVAAILRLVQLAQPVGELDIDRLEAARRLERLGLRGAAEQLWLSLKNSGDPRVRAAAGQDLCRLWADGGWLAWAADEYIDLRQSGRLDAAWNQAWTAAGAGAVVRDLVRTEWPTELHARIEVHARERPLAAAPTDPMGRRSRRDVLGQLDNWILQESAIRGFGFGGALNPLRLPPDWPVGLVAQPRVGTWGLGFVDRLNWGQGREAELRYPFSNPASVRMGLDEVGSSGTLIPLAVPGGVLAISPLDGDEAGVWDQRPAILRTRTTRPRCGVLHPDLTVLQSHNVLFALNTVDGRLLWVRRDLPPRSGFDQHPFGVFGSRDALAVLTANRKDFLVYRQRDGSTMATVTLPRSGSNRDVVVGDSLFFVGDPPEPGSTKRPLLRWSPGEDRPEVVGDLHERLQIRAVDDNHVCYLAPGPVLKLYAVAQRRERVSVSLAAAQVQQIRDFKAWVDEDRLYVNIQRDAQRVETRDFNEFPRLGSFGGPDLQPIRDDLFAVDFQTQKIAWSRRLPFRGLLSLSNWRVPFWLLFSHIRHREDQTLVTLRLELLDLRSGEIVATRDSLPTQEGLLGLFVDPVRREFTVLGNTRIFSITVNPGRPTPSPSRQAQAPRLDRR